MPCIYLRSSKSHSSGLPGSACTASPGSCPTSLKTRVQRCSGPGSHGPSALQSPAVAAASHRHTTPPVKAQHQGQHVRRARSKGTWFCSSAWCLLPYTVTSLPVLLPTYPQNHGSSHLVFSFESTHWERWRETGAESHSLDNGVIALWPPPRPRSLVSLISMHKGWSGKVAYTW